MGSQRMLTVSEAAERLGVSPRTVRRQIAAGRVPEAEDVGAAGVPRYRIPAAAIARMRKSVKSDNWDNSDRP